MMGTEWPATRLFPNQIVPDDGTVSLGGIGFRVRSLGPGESFADTVWAASTRRTLFAGDVAYNEMHAYLADGRWLQWLETLDRLEREPPPRRRCTSGTGHPGTGNCWPASGATSTRSSTPCGRHADAVAGGDYVPVLDEPRRAVPNEDLLFLADLSIDAVLSTVTEPS